MYIWFVYNVILSFVSEENMTCIVDYKNASHGYCGNYLSVLITVGH